MQLKCNHWTEQNFTKLDRKQDRNILKKLCFVFGPIGNTIWQKVLWLAETFSPSSMQPLGWLRTDDGQRVITIVHLSLLLTWTKKRHVLDEALSGISLDISIIHTCLTIGYYMHPFHLRPSISWMVQWLFGRTINLTVGWKVLILIGAIFFLNLK